MRRQGPQPSEPTWVTPEAFWERNTPLRVAWVSREGAQRIASVASVMIARVRRSCAVLVAGLLVLVAAAVAGPAHPAASAPAVDADRARILDLGAGSWCWFQDPRAVYLDGRTYAGWVDDAGYVVIARIGSGTLERVRIARLGTRVYHDDHDAPALLVQPDGRVTAFYSAHSGPHMFARTTLEPRAIGTWGPQEALPPNPGGGGSFTYPNPAYLSSEGRTYLFYRGGGEPTFTTRDANGAWSPARLLIDEPGAVPYLKVASNGRDTIYFAFTDGHPRNFVTSIYFAEYRQGVLSRADGSPIAPIGSAPIRPQQAERVFQASAAGGRAWVDDVAVGPRGEPVVLYTTFPFTARAREYHYAAWDGRRWQVHDLGPGGSTITGVAAERFYSGGIDLDHNDPSVVYASVGSFGHHRIERLSTPDGGRTWRRRWISAGSADGVRPVVPRGLPPGREQVLWMSGHYGRWQDPGTSILASGLG